jgi:HSP20 family protein
MALIRWEPFGGATASAPATTNRRRFVPAIDVAERDDTYVIHADLPGLDRDDVDLSLEGRVLTLSGSRTHESETTKAGWVRVERSSGSFRRAFTLPEGVDATRIVATFDKGVLEVVVPKPAASRPQKVEITVGSPDSEIQLEDRAAEQAATS